MNYSAYITVTDGQGSTALSVCAATALSAPSGPRQQQAFLQVAILQSPQQFVQLLATSGHMTIQEAAEQLQKASTDDLQGGCNTFPL